MAITWRLKELMTERGIRSSAELARRLRHLRGEASSLSDVQVYRLVEQGPSRLSIDMLDSLCVVLETTPAELLTRDVEGLPTSLLSTLLVASASSAAHENACAGRGAGMRFHPGDSFGKVLGWLWRTGRRDRAALLVHDYLAQMRVHNPHRVAGELLTWDDLKFGIRMALNPADVPIDRQDEFIEYLDKHVPGMFGQSVKALNDPND